MKKMYLPPHTNRGVRNTTALKNKGFLKNAQRVCVDWCQFTIHDKFGYSPYDYFDIFFGIKKDDIIFEKKGLFCYQYTYRYRNIMIFTSDNENFGMHVYLTGQACRDFEDITYRQSTGIIYYERHTSWLSLFTKALKYDANFTRLDIAIDDFSKNYFTLDDLGRCILNKEVLTRFKDVTDFKKTDIADAKTSGRTLWFGSRASLVQVVFYDKLLERRSQNIVIDEDIKFWLRCEIRFRADKANEVVKRYVEGEDTFSTFIKGVLDYYVSFCDYNPSDKNRSRWKRKEWWNRYLDNVEKSRLSSIPVESTITIKKAWIDNTVSASEFSVLLSSLDNLALDDLTSDYLLRLLKSGFSRFDSKKLEMVNVHRLSNNLAPLTMDEIEDFMKDIQQVILVSNK